VRGSGLWNQQHVEESHDPIFLDALAEKIDAVRCGKFNNAAQRGTRYLAYIVVNSDE
jgi:hypothetical protein